MRVQRKWLNKLRSLEADVILLADKSNATCITNRRRLWHDEGGYAGTIIYRQLMKDPTPTKERQKLGEGG